MYSSSNSNCAYTCVLLLKVDMEAVLDKGVGELSEPVPALMR